MTAVEFGKEHGEVILLLHGGGLSWWNYREAAQLLQSGYRVVLPVLDGHAGSERPFTTIEDCAAAMIEWIDREYGGSVALIGGVSLGAQVLLEMLAQRPQLCRCAVVESALARPMPLTRALTKPMLWASYGLIQKPWFAKLQFRALRLRAELYEEYYRDTCRITRQDMAAFLQANAGYRAKPQLGAVQAKVLVAVGAKEPPQMVRSARLLHRLLPGSVLRVLPGWYHGEFSLNHAPEYARALTELLRQPDE